MKILVTGGTGLVGTGLKNISHKYSNYEFFFLSRKQADLTNYNETLNYFSEIKPDYIIHLAACVGGLYKNLKYKVEMYENNMLINLNVLKVAYEIKVKKLICCLSTCIFPDKTSYPINELMLHNGPPHNSNYSYAHAKRMLEIQCRAYNEQYNTNFICIIPTNIYGENDNFNLFDAHVIPALIHKCYLAVKSDTDFIIDGNGEDLRQFIYSKDLAELILWIIENYNDSEPIILSPNEKDEVSIKNIAMIIAEKFNYSKNIIFDISKPSGQYKKTADNSKFKYLYSDFIFTNIKTGIDKTVDWFIENYDKCRK